MKKSFLLIAIALIAAGAFAQVKPFSIEKAAREKSERSSTHGYLVNETMSTVDKIASTAPFASHAISNISNDGLLINKQVLRESAISIGAYPIRLVPNQKRVFDMPSIGGGDTPDDKPKYELSINVSEPSESFDLIVGAFIVVDKETQKVVTSGNPDKDWNYDSPIKTADPVPNGTYYIWGLADNGKSYPEFHPINYYAEVVIADGPASVDVNFEECVNKLQITAVMGNGEAYPETSPDPQPTDSEFTMLDVSFGTTAVYTNYFVYGSADFVIYANNWPIEVAANYNFNYLNFEESMLSEMNAAFSGPIDSDKIAHVSKDYYSKLENQSSLSAEDLKLGYRGMATGDYQMQFIPFIDDKYITSVALHTSMRMIYGESDDFLVAYVPYISESHNAEDPIWEQGIYTGFLCKGTNDMNHKLSGITINLGGEQYLIGRNLGKNPEFDGKNSLYSVADIYNFKNGSQEIVNFLNPLYGNASLTIAENEETGLIQNAYATLGFYGPFHEMLFITPPDEDACLELIMDGTKINPYELFGIEAKGHKFDMNLSYDYGWVQNQFPVQYKLETSFSTDNDVDWISPQITGYQLRNSEGQVTGLLKSEEVSTLYISVIDKMNPNVDNDDFKVQIQAAPQESENWTSLEYDVETMHGDVGNMYTIKVDDKTFNTNTWYKVKVYAEDASGNTMSSTLDYLFYIANSDKVESIEQVDSQTEEFYNLQGIKIDRPTNGIYIVRQGNKVVKKVI